MPTETDKHTALADFVESTLNNVKSGVRVETFFRAARTGQKSERDRLMGDPVYYCEVGREGYRTGPGDVSSGQAPYMPEHEYGIRLWHEYEDEQSSKDIWDTLIEDSGGLIRTLRQQEKITAGGNRYPIDQPQDVQEVVTRLSTRGGNPEGDLAWYLEFSIRASHKES